MPLPARLPGRSRPQSRSWQACRAAAWDDEDPVLVTQAEHPLACAAATATVAAKTKADGPAE
jgi:hypothetical protein